jgi:hypothetical protein
VNPEKAAEVLDKLYLEMFPEMESLEIAKEEHKMEVLEAYADKAFRMMGDGRGHYRAVLVDRYGEPVRDPFVGG